MVSDQRSAKAKPADKTPLAPMEGPIALVCTKAADHVAAAREALSLDSPGPAEALARLEQAIDCLKSISSTASAAAEPETNTVLPFPKEGQRRSA